MKLKLIPLKKSVIVGDKLPIQAIFNFEEQTDLFWSGIRLLTSPPCSKNLQITKKEIFSKGLFEPGEYIREKAITIKNNVVPTIEKRNLDYRIELLLRTPNPVNPDEDIIIKKNEDIKIKPKKTDTKKKPSPLSFSISGLNVNLRKDVFKPGETIKINYTSEGLREIEFRLLQEANLICHCEQYGKNCQQVENLPPAIAGDVKTKSNTEQGYLLLKVPEVAEPSHNYLWEPSEKEHWGVKYGDYSKWSLLVIGRKMSGKEPIKFDLPITISSEIVEEEEAEADLFSGSPSEAPSVFESMSSKLKKDFQIDSIDLVSAEDHEIKKYKVLIKNNSNEDLEGATVKLTGLQEGLFETAPYLFGYNKWKSGKENEIMYETKQEITALVANIEDNSQKKIRLQKPIN
ncbi:MAG: hypothetical protein ACQERB_06670 [Promethearchaeati archaeon]